MSDNVSVKSTQPDSPPAGYTATTYKVTTRQAEDNSQIQQVQLDIGIGTNKSPVTTTNPLPTEDPRMVFTNDGKLQVNATVTMGEVTIEETHIVDPLTATAANVKSDGVNNGLVVVQNSQPLPTGAATSDLQTSGNTLIGAVTETAPGTDTASSGLNGRLQRIAQRLTSLIALLPTALGAGGGIKVDGSGTALPVSGSVTANAGTNLNTSALALESGGNLATIAGKDFATQTTLALIKAKTDNIDVALSTRTKPSDTQTVSGTVTANAGTNLNTSALALESGGNLASLATHQTDGTQVSRVLFDPSNMSAFGSLESVEMTPVIQGDWVYGINSQLWSQQYVFTVTSPASPPAVGDIYSNSNNTFVVTYISGTTMLASGSGNPAASGNLARVTGAGTNPIVYSAFTTRAGVVNGTGATIDTDASRLRIQSGTGSAGYSYITSRRIVRYRAGQGTVARFTPLFTTGVANNTQLWGMGSIVNNAPYDGYFFGTHATDGSFGIAYYNKGNLTFIEQTSWNVDKLNGTAGTAFNWDYTKGSPVMIKYPYLGYGDIEFFVQNPSTGRWVLCHVIQYANTSNATQLGNPTLQFLGFTLNSGNTSNMTMYCASVGVFISGLRSFIGNPKWAFDNNKTTITTETCILNLKNCTTYNGVANRGLIRLNSLSASNSANTTTTIRIKIGTTFAVTASWSAISGTSTDSGNTVTGNSIASVDTAGTTLSGGNYIYNINIGPSNTSIIDLTPFEIYVAPGEVATFSGAALANSTIGISANWTEDI